MNFRSCAGRKVPVDEFFKRKCGNFGELSGDAVGRPSLGLSINSPKRKGPLIPLVDSTIATEGITADILFQNISAAPLHVTNSFSFIESSVGSFLAKDKTQQNNPSAVKDVEEQSIMSLTSIAQALQDIENGTPRKLVDQLIMAKKKKKPVLIEESSNRNTYTLPSDRKSMPATQSRTVENVERDIGLLNLSSKLSLDSKITNEMVDAKHSISRILLFDSNTGTKTNLENPCEEFKREIKKPTPPCNQGKFSS